MPRSSGPNELTVARSCTPSFPLRLTNSTGTPARLCGIGLPEIEGDIQRRHGDAFADPAPKLADLGFVRYRKEGEPHVFEPPLVKLLQEAVNTGSGEAYRAYRDHVAQHAPTSVRDLMRVRPLGEPVAKPKPLPQPKCFAQPEPEPVTEPERHSDLAAG